MDRCGPVSEHILYELQPSMVIMAGRHNQNKGQFNKTVAQFVKILSVFATIYDYKTLELHRMRMDTTMAYLNVQSEHLPAGSEKTM